ncbi:MAG: 16S rRNA (cytosine(1402)-N(4))-methyltransferase RsmH [Anaerolineae bacterium]|nr:16S rRNA (cytosine(1402)-N(4))-methyltransferase RsmH [Thermoflexales bacterium]MDW8406700.1 16S rRNA (cytosine(1402)-N(4))-methyltransferase RsmH [Anaerolineae bacterium]
MIHVPVLLDEVVQALRPRATGRYLDATVGGGGHSEAILRASTPSGRLLATDADERAVQTAAERLQPFGPRVVLRRCWLDQAAHVAHTEGFVPLDGIVVDLGLSSNQLDDAERGFSFMRPGPLDMRFDRTQKLTAAGLINECDLEELVQILRDYGEVTRARRIAEAIWSARPLHTTDQLRTVVTHAAGARYSTGRRPIHPATQVFQALRIAVNDELRRLETALPRLIETLAVGGRLAVITFHSLEDRIVKRAFRLAAGQDGGADADPRNLLAGRQEMEAVQTAIRARLVNKKPILPTDEEIRQNPRARSAKLRILERIDVA